MVLFPERLADGSEWSQVEAEGQAWFAVVQPNDNGGWTAKCFDRLEYSFYEGGIPAFVPKVPQPRPTPKPPPPCRMMPLTSVFWAIPRSWPAYNSSAPYQTKTARSTLSFGRV